VPARPVLPQLAPHAPPAVEVGEEGRGIVELRRVRQMWSRGQGGGRLGWFVGQTNMSWLGWTCGLMGVESILHLGCRIVLPYTHTERERETW
jgi:hypothetical protein